MTFDANLCPALYSGGLGDRGFRSAELRLLGPGTVLVEAGLTLVRILPCLVSSLARLRSSVYVLVDSCDIDIEIHWQDVQ